MAETSTVEKDFNSESSADVRVNQSPYTLMHNHENMYLRSILLPDEIRAAQQVTKSFVDTHPGSFKSDPFFTAGSFLWESIKVGGRMRDSEELFRGYLMVEPEQLQLALDKLLSVADKREKEHLKTGFKWLLGTRGIGDYTNLFDDSSRVVLYGETQDEILEVLQSLVEEGWDDIEQYRIALFNGDVNNTPRRKGASEFKDKTGKYWRSINFNTEVGHADESSDGTGRPINLRVPYKRRFDPNWTPDRPKYEHVPLTPRKSIERHKYDPNK